ncbi:MAG TPA: hypothetical protein VJ183_18030 [Chloroflexia bacterium]|nr:hypothetical protein [Chloroflexia bacterium]
MNDELLAWVLLAPLLGGLVAIGLWLASRRKGASPQSTFWLDATALVSICAGLMVGPVLVLLAGAGAGLSLWEVDFTLTPVAQVVLPVSHAALLAAVFFAWDDDEENPAHGIHPIWLAGAAMGTAILIAGALLVEERTVRVLLLFGMALVASGVAIIRTRGSSGGSEQARKLAGGLKHLALASVATALLVAGATLLDRYSLSLERRALLQLGLSLLSVGLLVRAGAMPFAAPFSDTMRAAPGVAILIMGAAVPATLGVGLLMLTPVEGSVVSASQTAWVAAVGVLLAGVRAVGISDFGFVPKAVSDLEKRQRAVEVGLPVLGAMSVAAQVGWAMFGVLSGSRIGATGAVLLAANIAIAFPLLIVSIQKEGNLKSEIRNPKSEIGIMAGAASLLGLPPFGGFIGTLMVAQAAANVSGIWLGALLLGTLFVGMAWAWAGIGMNAKQNRGSEVGQGENTDPSRRRWGTAPLLIIVLIAVQLGLFLVSGQIADTLGNWAGAPWMLAP